MALYKSCLLELGTEVAKSFLACGEATWPSLHTIFLLSLTMAGMQE